MTADEHDARAVLAQWGESVEYKRGPRSATLTAQTRDVEYELTDTEGFRTSAKSFAFDFLTEDMIFDDEVDFFEPREGDRITITRNGRELTYQVLPHGKWPVAEWNDTSGAMTTVHTKLVRNA